AGPYYWVTGRRVAQYIYTNLYGQNAHLWAYEASPSEHILFYLTGNGATEILGRYGSFLGATILLGGICILRRGRKEEFVGLAALASVMLVSWAVPTASPMKHAFYGLTFMTLILFAALLSLRALF